MATDDTQVPPLDADFWDGRDTPSSIDILTLDGSSMSPGEFLKWDGSKLVSDTAGGSGDGTTVSSSPPFSVLPSGIVDSSSIVENAGGVLEVRRPAHKIIGDWESGTGAWSLGGIAGRDNTNAHLGSYSMAILGNGNTNQGSFSRSVDLTGYETLGFWGMMNLSDGGWDLIIGGDTVLSQVGSTSWKKWTVDVSGYSGSTTVEFNHYYRNIWIDEVFLVEPKVVYQGPGSGT